MLVYTAFYPGLLLKCLMIRLVSELIVACFRNDATKGGQTQHVKISSYYGIICSFKFQVILKHYIPRMILLAADMETDSSSFNKGRAPQLS